VSPVIDFRVHPAYYKLAGRINSALASAVASAPRELRRGRRG
jgi:hypothetical protein